MANDIPDEWQQLTQLLDKKRSLAKAMGGEDKLNKRKANSLPNAREAITAIVDEDSFQEIGTLVGSLSYHGEKLSPCDALVGGLASIQQQACVICCEDFTVQGGSIGHGTNAKRVRLATIALEQKLPFIMLLDGAGARMSNALTRHPYGPNDLQIINQLIGIVPTIAVVIGSSAGHGAVGGVMMDLVIMLKNASLFTAGPPLVQAATGEIIDKEGLGGSDIHSKQSGVCDLVATDIEQASSFIQYYLSLLSIKDTGLETSHQQDQNKLYHIIPADAAKAYDMKSVINTLCDQDSFLELKAEFAKTMITGLARLRGKTVAIIANQPKVLAGAIDYHGAIKATEFIQTIDSYNIPFLFLADTPGVMSGSQAEQQGTLRVAANMYKAVQNMQSKKLHVTIRKAYGFASCVMAMNPFDKQAISLGVLGLNLGGIPATGGTKAANMSEKEAKKIANAQASGAWTAGDALAYDEIVKPCEILKILSQKL